MPDFYYQIKARQNTDNEYSRWIWPPVFSGMVQADDKKQARALVDAEYEKKFPMRVAAKDLESASFLLNMYEVHPDDDRTRGLFEIQTCKQCHGGFRVIDHYNNWIERYSGREFCSDDCHQAFKKANDARLFVKDFGGCKALPVIYMIQNRNTGRCYIGKTTQPFTLRWWQHFFHGTDTKFHKAIADSKVTDCTFSVVEVIDIGIIGPNQDVQAWIRSREQHWIDTMDAINNGYNTAISAKEEEPEPPMLAMFETNDYGQPMHDEPLNKG